MIIEEINKTTVKNQEDIKFKWKDTCMSKKKESKRLNIKNNEEL